MAAFAIFVLPISVVLLIWGVGFALTNSKRKKHRQRWRELAEASGMKYEKDGNATARALANVPEVDCPRLGVIHQAIVGQLDGCWCAIVESVVRRQSLGDFLGKPVRTTSCVIVDPKLNLPEFSLKTKAGRSATDIVNALVESSVIFEGEFKEQYVLRSLSSDTTKQLFGDSVRRWFVETKPLDMPVRHHGDTSEIQYYLELHAQNNTITLCCPVPSVNPLAGPYGKNYGPLEAKDIQGFLSRVKDIRKTLGSGSGVSLASVPA